MVDIYEYKLVALLHDPPWKPWVITQYFNGKGRILSKKEPSERVDGEEYCKAIVEIIPFTGIDEHEREAMVLLKHLAKNIKGFEELSRRLKELIDSDIVIKADSFASSIDRWFIESSLKASGRIEMPSRIVNIVNPKYYIDYSIIKDKINVKSICNFTKDLLELAKKLNNSPKWFAYNVLLLAYEILWYKNCNLCVPVADTRTPTHTVFDHVNATASMINWFIGSNSEAPEGYLVKIDIASVQDFISRARKIRDLWMGSWLVSALAWCTISELVLYLGADIVLSPNISLNPFYTSTILREANNLGLNELVKFLKENVLSNIHSELFKVPTQPVIPATLYLALPPVDIISELNGKVDTTRLSSPFKKFINDIRDGSSVKDSLKKYFVRRFKKCWERIIEALYESLEGKRNVEELLYSLGLDEKESNKRYFEETINEPPLQLRVTVVNVSNEFKEFKNIVKDKLNDVIKDVSIKFNVKVDNILNKLFYHWLFTYALTREDLREANTVISFKPGYLVSGAVEKYTNEIYKKRKRIRLCSMCGKLPAIIRLPHGEEFAEVRDKLIVGKLGLPKTLFIEGETLCPYCLVRRLLSVEKVFANVLDKIGLYFDGTLIHVPSTNELATLNTIVYLEKKILENNALNKLKEVVSKGSFYYHTIPGLFKAKYVSKGKERDLEETVKLISYALSELGLDDQLIMLATDKCDEQKCKLLYEIVRAIAKNDREFKLLLDEFKRRSNLYYTIIIGDGDNFGKLVKGVTPLSTGEYLSEVGKAMPKSVQSLFQSITDDITSLVSAFNNFIRTNLSVLGVEYSDATLIISPAYHSALSRGLMITSITDTLLSNLLGGFVVYSGGDDVFIMAPVYIDKELLQLQSNVGGQRDLICDVFTSDNLGRVKIPCSGFIAADLIVITRRNYWGIDSYFKGFHIIGNLLIAAIPAYGRSYGLLITHYKDPLWPAWRLCHMLEELKSSIKTYYEPKLSIEKDSTIALYGRISGLVQLTRDLVKQLVILPNYHVNDDYTGYALSLAAVIAENLGILGVFSSSLTKDVITSYNYAYNDNYSNLAFRILVEIIKRNTPIHLMKVANDLEKLLERFKNVVVEKNIKIITNSEITRELTPWAIIRMADYLKSGSR